VFAKTRKNKSAKIIEICVITVQTIIKNHKNHSKITVQTKIDCHAFLQNARKDGSTVFVIASKAKQSTKTVGAKNISPPQKKSIPNF